MLKINQNIAEVLEELRALSNQNTDSSLRVNVPTVFRDFSYVRKDSFRDTHRILNGKFSLQESTMLLSYDIPFSTFQNKSTYMERLDYLVEHNYVYPFLFFVDGKFIKWSDIYIIRDCRYSYILITKVYSVENKFEMVTLPKNVEYKERSTIKSNTLFSFRDGLFYNGGEECSTINNVGYTNFYYEEIKLRSDKIQLFNLDPEYEMNPDNIIVFKDGELYTDNFNYHCLNMFSVDGNELHGEYHAKGFYWYKANQRQNNDRVIMRKYNTRAIASNLNIVPNYLNLFKDKFNFSFSFSNKYQKNLMNGLNYVMLYNSGLMNRLYKKLNKTISRYYTGKELRALVKYGNVTMSRRVNGKVNNHVMIFHNGELYKYYNQLQYKNKDFIFPFKDIDDKDTIEILYFLDIDNREFPIVLASKREDAYFIDDSIDVSHLKLFTIQPEHLDFNIEISPHKQYELRFDYDIHDEITIIRPKSPFYYDKRLTMVSERQFRYYYYKAKYRVIDVILPSEQFKFCNDSRQYMVFINGRKINSKEYKVVIPSYDNPFDDNSIYFDIPLEAGDYIEVFYIPDIMSEVQSNKTLSSNGNIYLDKSKLKHNISRDLNFVFVNGKKIPYDDLYDISQTLMKVTTDVGSVNNLCILEHVEYDNLLTNIFAYNKDRMTRIIDSLTEEQFNILFDNANIKNKEQSITSNTVSTKVLIYSIIKDYYCAPFTNVPTTFAFDNIDECFNDYDDEANLILDWLEGNRENKPLRGREDK